MIKINQLADKLKRETKVALFCHIRPDGDALGSSLALKLALEKIGIESKVFCDDIIPAKFSFLPQISQVERDGFNAQEYSALIAVDCAEQSRIGDYVEGFLSHKNTYNIDHHISNTRYAKTNYVVDNGANAENVYEIIKELKVEIDSQIANLLAMGIMTDTGNFHHKNVTEKTLTYAGQLVKNGADLNKIYFHMFASQTKFRAKLFGAVMSKINFLLDDRLAIATVSLTDIETSKAKPEDTEGFVDFLMGIDSVEVGICLLEMSKDVYKASIRSKCADVNQVALSFGGGGHKLASGCKIFGDIYEVIDRLRFEVSKALID